MNDVFSSSALPAAAFISFILLLRGGRQETGRAANHGGVV